MCPLRNLIKHEIRNFLIIDGLIETKKGYFFLVKSVVIFVNNPNHPPHKLAFSWVWDDDPSNPQMIELQFSEQGGATTVLMINSGITSERQRGEQQGGWRRCYDNLDLALSEDPEQSQAE